MFVQSRGAHAQRPNESLEINCSLPEAGGAVRWYHEGKELGEARGRWSVRGRTLVIASARSSDAGAYSCRAGDREASALQVVAPVVLEPVRRPYVADAGDTVSIPCKVLAGRPSRVSWLVGGVPLGASGSRARLSRSASGVADSLLTLPDVAPEDSNVYTCRARHEQCSRPVAAAQETSLHVWPHGVRTNEELPGAGLTIR
ncbi:cell adhesion molecule 4-like [Haemaphysalis longicornis]